MGKEKKKGARQCQDLMEKNPLRSGTGSKPNWPHALRLAAKETEFQLLASWDQNR